MSPRNFPLDSSSWSSPLVRTWAHARFSISATVFLWCDSDASIDFHSSFVTESRSTSLIPKPSASSPSGSADGAPAGGTAALSAA